MDAGAAAVSDDIPAVLVGTTSEGVAPNVESEVVVVVVGPIVGNVAVGSVGSPGLDLGLAHGLGSRVALRGVVMLLLLLLLGGGADLAGHLLVLAVAPGKVSRNIVVLAVVLGGIVSKVDGRSS